MSNQLKAHEKFQMAIHLKEKWDDYKLKTQPEIAEILTAEFNRPVTRLNVSSVMRMAGLKQQGRARGTHHPSNATIKAMARTLVTVVEALRQLDIYLNENSETDCTACQYGGVFSTGADAVLDANILALREFLNNVEGGIPFGGKPNTDTPSDEDAEGADDAEDAEDAQASDADDYVSIEELNRVREDITPEAFLTDEAPEDNEEDE